MPTGASLRYWIDASLECIRRSHGAAAGDQRGPFLSARVLGMAMAALHDGSALAYGARPILQASRGIIPLGTNPLISCAAACHEVLSIRYPNQAGALQHAWRVWLELNTLTPDMAAEAHGRALGIAIESWGARDAKLAAPIGYLPSGRPYTHAVPPTGPDQGFVGPRWGLASPLAATRIFGFPPPPGRLSSTSVVATAHYARDFEHVVGKGVLKRACGTRTLAEEITGIFWSYDGAAELGTQPRLYMQVLLRVLDNLDIAKPASLTVGDELRIVAGVAIAMADAGIDAWHYKYAATHMMWQPALGIPNAVPGNGFPLPDWRPLGVPDTNGSGDATTPNFPSYPSAHATLGAAAFHLLRLYLVEKGLATFDANGVDNVRFDFTSDQLDGRHVDAKTGQPRDLLVKSFDSLWSAITENALSPVYLGLHWRFDGITTRRDTTDVFGVPTSPLRLGKTGGVWLGMQIANQLAPLIGITASTIKASGSLPFDLPPAAIKTRTKPGATARAIRSDTPS
jgi:hypothetical protein